MRPGDELARLLERELERLGVDRVGLRDRDDAALDAEEPEDREVLVRLRTRALRGVDDEQEEVDPRRAGDHRPHEPLVAGDVDERQRAAAGQLERRVAEVDRDPARLLLGEPVGVLPRQRPDERRLAVVDVTGGADRQRHDEDVVATASVTRPLCARLEHGAGDLVDLVVRERARVEQEAAVAHDADDRRLARAAARRASSSSTAHAALGSSASGSAPPPTRATVSSTSPPIRPASRSARAADGLERLVEHPEHGDLAPRALGVRRAGQSVPSSAASVSLSARSARWSGWRRRRSTRSARPTTMPACGPPRSLSPGEADEVGSRGDARSGGRLVAEVEERAGAEVVDERQAGPPRDLPRAPASRRPPVKPTIR